MKQIIILFVIICLSCADNRDERLDSIGSSFVVQVEDPNEMLSSETYNKEAIQILESHKKKLKSILPQMLLAEVNIYKNTLQEIQKVSVLTYTLDDYNKEVSKIHEEAGVTLVIKEMELNSIYFELFNELSLLNYKYRSLQKEGVNFVDFYDAGPIVLADEVMIKIDELVKDEDVRVELEKAKNNRELAFSALTIIPGTSVCKSILSSVAQAAKKIKDNEFIKKQGFSLTKIAHKLMNEKTSKFMSKALKNDEIRTKISKAGYISPFVKGTRMIVDNSSNFISSEESVSIFKVIENKINGRIGDFSDGILAVHLQKIRDIIKTNSDKINL